MNKKITIIIPIYNEVSNVTIMLEAIHKTMNPLPYTFNIFFVDDGSSDDSLTFIKQLCASNEDIKYISFSRNFGHQNALKAGFDLSNADAVISMDGDMQHPPSLLPQLLALWEAGNDVVYTVREKKKICQF
jgi:polyisoprenyl-phosphate glycosyltransferase